MARRQRRPRGRGSGPSLHDSTYIIVRVTSSGLCGLDLHLYTVLAPLLDAGDVLGHEPMGIIEEVGPDVTALNVGDRVVIPFNVSCEDCWMCGHDLHSQRETTQVHEYGTVQHIRRFPQARVVSG